MKGTVKIIVCISMILAIASSAYAKPFFKPIVTEFSKLPDEEATIITYYGSTFLNTTLYKVNNQPRTEYIENTFAASYSQVKSFGFAIKVAPGITVLELLEVKSKKMLVISGDFGKGRYELTNEKGALKIVNEIDKTEIPVTIREVERYASTNADKATIVVDKVKDYSPILFRINDMMPPNNDNYFAGNYSFCSTASAGEIEIDAGEVTLDYAIFQETITNDTCSLITVNQIKFTAEKGKRYKIETTAEKDPKDKKVMIVSTKLIELK